MLFTFLRSVVCELVHRTAFLTVTLVAVDGVPACAFESHVPVREDGPAGRTDVLLDDRTAPRAFRSDYLPNLQGVKTRFAVRTFLGQRCAFLMEFHAAFAHRDTAFLELSEADVAGVVELPLVQKIGRFLLT